MTRSSSELNARMTAQILDDAAQPLNDNGYALRVVETRGRVSGRAHQTPLGVTQVDDRLYLVCPDRRRDWVQNLLAHGECSLLAGGGRDRLAAAATSGKEAADVVSTYLNAVKAPWALSAFPVAPGTSSAEIMAHLDVLAVFRLTPACSGDA